MKNLLLVTPFTGVVCLLLLFLISFFCVHIARLVKFGWKYQQKKPAPKKSEPAPESEKKAPAPQEPIYYIVERKKRRAKPTYGEPKQFRFKD